MAILEESSVSAPVPPLLEQGDVLTRSEFERRYAAMSDVKKAELIDGIVHMGSSVRASHGIPHADLAALLRVYASKHPGLIVADNSTVRLDPFNEPQPDLLMMRTIGQAQLDADGYVNGAPEFIAEIAASTASRDLHQKKRAYQRAGVLEYLVWLADEKRLIWWQLKDDEFVEVPADEHGVLTSPNFPGLVIDSKALLAGDFAAALARLGG